MSMLAQMQEQGIEDVQVLDLARAEDRDWAENGGDGADELAYLRHERMDELGIL